MSFTIKYRTYRPGDCQDTTSFPNYVPHEQLHGPFAMVSQEVENGYVVIYCHDEHGDGRMMFGPWIEPCTQSDPQPSAPRPTLWVMNVSGATVAKYDL